MIDIISDTIALISMITLIALICIGAYIVTRELIENFEQMRDEDE